MLSDEVQAFAECMDDTLSSEENIDKGGWHECDLAYLLRRLYEEAGELRDAMVNGDIESMGQEAADVANFAMMIWDRGRALAQADQVY